MARSLGMSLSLPLELCLPSPPRTPAQLRPARGSHRHSCVDLPLPHHSPSLSIPSFLSPQVWRTLGPFCEVNVVFALFCALPSALMPWPALAPLQPLPEGFPWQGEGRLERKAPSQRDRWAALHAGTLGSPQFPFPLRQCSRVLAVSTFPRGERRRHWESVWPLLWAGRTHLARAVPVSMRSSTASFPTARLPGLFSPSFSEVFPLLPNRRLRN